MSKTEFVGVVYNERKECWEVWSYFGASGFPMSSGYATYKVGMEMAYAIRDTCPVPLTIVDLEGGCKNCLLHREHDKKYSDDDPDYGYKMSFAMEGGRSE